MDILPKAARNNGCKGGIELVVAEWCLNATKLERMFA